LGPLKEAKVAAGASHSYVLAA
jgi:hypothetical protein